MLRRTFVLTCVSFRQTTLVIYNRDQRGPWLVRGSLEVFGAKLKKVTTCHPTHHWFTISLEYIWCYTKALLCGSISTSIRPSQSSDFFFLPLQTSPFTAAILSIFPAPSITRSPAKALLYMTIFHPFSTPPLEAQGKTKAARFSRLGDQGFSFKVSVIIELFFFIFPVKQMS